MQLIFVQILEMIEKSALTSNLVRTKPQCKHSCNRPTTPQSNCEVLCFLEWVNKKQLSSGKCFGDGVEY